MRKEVATAEEDVPVCGGAHSIRPGGQCPAHRIMRFLLATALTLLTAMWHAGVSPAGANESLRAITQVTEIRRLSPEEARRKHPINLSGVVTYNAPEYGVTFVQDSTGGIFLFTRGSPTAARAGDRVEVRGITGPGEFAPAVDNPQIRILGRDPLPAPHRVPIDELFTGKEDSQWVEVEGIVRSVVTEHRLPPDMREGPPFLVLGIASGNGRFRANIGQFQSAADSTGLIDAAVTIRGVCATLFNEKRQLIGIQIFVPAMEQVQVSNAAPQNPRELPLLPINGLMQFSPGKISGHRVRVQGMVTLNRPGRLLFIQDDSGGVGIETTQNAPVRPGDLVEALGFPAAGQYTPILEDGEFRKIGSGTLPVPFDLSGATELNSDKDAQLVSIQGTLIDQSIRGTNLVLTMQKGSLIFTAQLERTAAGFNPIPAGEGSQLQLTGVWSVETDKYRRPTAFRVLLRSAADVVVIKRPSWWTGARIVTLLSILAGTILLGALWVIILRRRVDERTEMVRAALESTADGILVIDSAGKIAAYNQKFAEMWRIPESLLKSRDDNKLLDFVVTQLKNPKAFLDKVRELYADPEAQTDDLIEFMDGCVFERHSEPQRVKGRSVGRVWGFRDITERNRVQEEREGLILQLKEALSRVRLLSGMLPICACCKKIRDDSGYWNQIEAYILRHSEAVFSHAICPQCMEKLYPEYSGEADEGTDRQQN